MISIYSWSATDQTLKSLVLSELPTHTSGCDPDTVLWVDLNNPTAEEEERIFTQFLGVHSLTYEDITKARREPEQGSHLPKVEEFRDSLFVIVNPLPQVWSKLRRRLKDRPQLSAIIQKHLLITHHYQEVNSINTTQQYIQRHQNCMMRGPDYLFHLILDGLVDEYAPVTEYLANQLDRLEGRIFRAPSPEILGELLRIKREISFLRKTLILEREVLARLIRGEFELVDTKEIIYYRNVYDHLVRYNELIEASREMVSDLMQSYLAATSNKLNEIMKILTMISTVVLPMTLVAGIYGMNFKHMPELDWPYGYPLAMLIMLSTGIVSFKLFRWKKWL